MTTGFALGRKVNGLAAYYQTNEEVDLLRLNGWQIADTAEAGYTLVDFGCR